MDIKQALRDMALLHQSVRAEQQMKAIADLQRQSEHQTMLVAHQAHQMADILFTERLDRKQAEQEREQERLLKQHVFKLRQEVEAALGNQQPLVRYIWLLDIKEVATSLDVSELPDIQDKQYHADTLKMLSSGCDVAKEFGENVLKALQTLQASLRKVHRIATDLAQFDTKLSSTRPSQKDIRLWREQFGALEGAVMKAEEAASEIPGLPLDAFPLGKAVHAARAGILVPVSVNQFAFKCFVLLAKADGRLDPVEAQLLAEFGCHVRIPNEDVQRLLAETQSVKRSEFRGDQEAAELILRNLYRCAAIDGRISPREQKMIEKIGLGIGVAPETLADIIAGHGVETLFTILDPVATQTAFASAPNSAKKKAYIGNTVPNDLLVWFRTNFAIPDDEPPLITREWRSLGSRISALLLTHRMAYLFTWMRRHRIPVEDIVAFAPGFLFPSGKLSLKGGLTVKTHNCMDKFLKALVAAVKAGIRSV